jgi:hypothetical protein
MLILTLKGTCQIVLAAVKQDGYALEFADSTFRQDRQIVLAAVKQDGRVLEFADSSLMQYRQIVLAAVKSNGLALEFADSSFRQDRKIVLVALKSNGMALEFASDDLKSKKKIVLAAVKSKVWAADFARYGVTGLRDLFVEDGAAHQFNDDYDIVLAAVKQDGMALAFAGAELKNDPKIVLAAVKSNGRALTALGVDPQLKNDPKIVLAAVKSKYWAAKVRNGKISVVDYHDFIDYNISSSLKDNKEIQHALHNQKQYLQALEVCHETESPRLCMLFVDILNFFGALNSEDVE